MLLAEFMSEPSLKDLKDRATERFADQRGADQVVPGGNNIKN